ncbi:MAG: replicative DNA helicase [Clostridiales bacterium]|nr:replicative DNA helicase [Candidatus Crickella merdequi]
MAEEVVVQSSEYAPVPPVDIEAEKAVLGSMMKDPDAVSDVIDKLKADDFYEKAHQEIFRVMVELFRKSIGIDLMTTYSALAEKKLSELVGGMTYLSKLVNDAIVSSNATYYADTVIAKSRMRALIQEAESIRSKAYAGGDDTEGILDYAEQRIFEIAHRSQKKSYMSINDVLVENIKHIQELEKNQGQLPGITTGFRAVDKVLGGLHKTDLIILAARPGMGKTSFALNIAQHAAEDGNSVLIFSMEMAAEQLGGRLLSMAANVEMEHLKMGNLTQDEWFAISDAQDAFDDMKITVDDTSEMSILEMKNKCRRLKAEKGLDLVIIDYLQLMSLGYNVNNRVGEISAITRAIKIMAKELDVAIILLSQLSRKTEDRKDYRPMLSDLRDSGSIEQDADVVIFLKRDDYYEKEDEPAEINPNVGRTCEVIIAKHRSGTTGTCQLAWVGKYTKFGNLASDTFEQL